MIEKKVKPKKGVKFDADKPMVDLVEPDFVLGLAEVLTFGAQKYAPDNWKYFKPKTGPRRIYAAINRHMLAFRKGEMYDPDSGLLHLDHAACGLMFLRWWLTDRGYNIQGKWSGGVNNA